MKILYNLILRSFVYLIVLGLFLSSPIIVLAQDDMPKKPNPVAEQWVREQIVNGRAADLSERFPNVSDRILGATFLRTLLVNSKELKIPDSGIIINNAIFVDRLDFGNIEVNDKIVLADCIFENYVDLSGAYFHKDFSVSGSIFNNGISLYRMLADRDVFIQNAEFNGQFALHTSEVKGSLYGDGVKFADPNAQANFFGMRVGKYLSLNNSSFSGGATFADINVGVNFGLSNVKFNNIEQGITFESLKVDNNFYVQESAFAGPARFVNVKVGNTFYAYEIKFTNIDASINFGGVLVNGSFYLYDSSFAGSASFDHMNIGIDFSGNNLDFTNLNGYVDFGNIVVGGSLFLREAAFAGNTSFVNARIDGYFNGSYSEFSNKDKWADFGSMVVRKTLRFENAIFSGAVDFDYLEVGYNLYLNGAKFSNPQEGVYFDNMKVGDSVFLRGTEFSGFAYFYYSQIGFDLLADKAKFFSSELEILFDNARIGGVAQFIEVEFRSGVSFNDGDFLDLVIQGTDEILPIKTITIDRVKVRRSLLLNNLEINSLSATTMVVSGIADFRNIQLVQTVDLENSSFDGLMLEDVEWPKPLNSVNMRGMVYQKFDATKNGEVDAWNELVKLVDHSKYSAQTYKELEDFFMEQGYSDRADKVYVAYKRRESSEALSWRNTQWYWNWFLDIFILYGRSPGRAFLWGALIIAFGCFVFNKKDGMIEIDKSRETTGYTRGIHGALGRRIVRAHYTNPRPYSPFWYSLDLFLVVINLGYDDRWAPRPDRKFAVIYSRLQMLFGWVLIPVALLAITGVIK